MRPKQPALFPLLACIGITLVFIIFIFPSCSKKGNGAPSNGTITASLNGVPFASTIAGGVFDTSEEALLMTGYYAIKGTQDSTVMWIGFWDTVNVGIPEAFDGSGIYLVYFDSLGNEWAAIGTNAPPTGTLTITSWDRDIDVISGTFTGVTLYNQGTTTDSLTVTGGKFTCPYAISP